MAAALEGRNGLEWTGTTTAAMESSRHKKDIEIDRIILLTSGSLSKVLNKLGNFSVVGCERQLRECCDVLFKAAPRRCWGPIDHPKFLTINQDLDLRS